jgi:Tol biopolymer transport system component
MRAWGRLVVAASAAVLLLAAPASAEDARRIAFSADGDLYVIAADGSERTRLTGTGAAEAGTAGQSYAPAWSPDGTRIAFARDVTEREDEERSAIFLMRADGREQRPLTVSRRSVIEWDPAWSPDGTRIAFARLRLTRRRALASIVVVNADGTGERVIARGASRSPFNLVSAPDWSPDARRLLYTRVVLRRNAYFDATMRAVGVDGSGNQALKREASDGSWSPDGSRIAFVSIGDRNGRDCGSDECSWEGELYVMNADGSGVTRLTRGKGAEARPGWSPDGTHIIFQSDRNYPDGDGPELYSVRPDGSCMTWLTNGTASSTDPSWEPGAGLSSDPGACGATARPPLIETDTGPARESQVLAYWLGEVAPGNMLLRHADATRRRIDFVYDDCGSYEPTECGGEIQLQSSPTCAHPALFYGLDASGLFRSHGALGYWTSRPEGASDLLTGPTSVAVFGPRRRAQLDAIVGELRRLEESSAPSELPPASLPNSFVRKLERVRAAYRRLRNVNAVARELGLSRRQVILRLAFDRKLRSLGPVGRLAC